MCLSIQEKKFKIDFQDGNCGGHLVFPIRMILAIFDLQVTSMTLTKFQVNWPFGSGKEAKKQIFKISMAAMGTFDLRHPDAFYQVSSQLAFPFRRRSEK